MNTSLDKKSKDELFGREIKNRRADAMPTPLTRRLSIFRNSRDTYFIYLYNFWHLYGKSTPYIPNELKGQISFFKVPLSEEYFKSGGILYFAFTDLFFFQVFLMKIAPVRDNDFQPEFIL